MIQNMKNQVTTFSYAVYRLSLAFVLAILFSLTSVNVGLAQSSCTDCNTACGGSGPGAVPCCNVWNACNYNQSFCYSNAGCPGSTVDPNTGCDLACTPIDSGVLFLLFGGAAFGGMMIMRRRQVGLEVIKQ